MKQIGLIHIYTGDGKGKTTSAVGLGVRVLGHSLKVCYVYFHKQPEKYGYTEILNLEKLGARVYGFAKGHPFCDRSINANDLAKQASEGLVFLKELLVKEHFDLLILDEIIISVRDGYLEEKQLLDFVKSKPQNLELVLTGRDASQALIELADYVSNISKIKHPYDHLITSREGIEY
jgi:cob(I)alamin adenosyltransferase